MKTYVLLHFEHKNDITIIIKLHRATRVRPVALYEGLTTIGDVFTVSEKSMSYLNKEVIHRTLTFL